MIDTVTTRLAALALGGVLMLVGCTGTPRPASSADGLGDWPTFLPSPTPGSAATGSPASPAMSYPGSPVVVRTDGGHGRVDVEGPSYPPGTKVGAERVEVTFGVTLSEASGSVDLRRATFDVLDHQGGIRRLTTSGRAMPGVVRPGERVELRLVGSVPAGEGLLRFYPAGSHAAAAWDYVTETD